MSTQKFRKMEKQIADMQKEISDLQAQVLMLAARIPQIFYTNPIPATPWPEPNFPGYQPILMKNDNVYDDGHKIMCEAISRTGN